jgi:flagellar basal-body rod modification protein FlgD
MAVDAAAAAAATGTSSTVAGKARLADNFDTFLTLLTTQMKNQDPMSPMDSTQFTQQLVQMSGVEQQLLTNDLLKTLVNSQSNGISAAVSLIGKVVRAVGDEAAIQDGKAQWSYSLPTDADEVKVEVLDSSGKVVHAETASENDAGEHAFTWNGKDLSGKQLADGGVYTLRVTAADSAGNTITATNFVEGKVTAVQQSDGQTYITVNGAQVIWDKVTKVALDDEKPASTTTASNTDVITDQTIDEAA